MQKAILTVLFVALLCSAAAAVALPCNTDKKGVYELRNDRLILIWDIYHGAGINPNTLQIIRLNTYLTSRDICLSDLWNGGDWTPLYWQIVEIAREF